MDWKKIVVGIAIGYALLVAVLFRFEVVPVEAGGQGVHSVAYRLDHWTGDIKWMSGARGGDLE
jgi:hypothetical protein